MTIHPETHDRPHWVYRCYSETGELLYIGCTSNLAHREANHRSGDRFGAADAQRRRLGRHAPELGDPQQVPRRVARAGAHLQRVALPDVRWADGSPRSSLRDARGNGVTLLDYVLAVAFLAVWLIGLALLASRSPSYVKQESSWSPVRAALRTLGSGRKVWR